VDSVIAPGDSVWVRLSFTTTNFYGPNNKVFSVYTSDPANRELLFYYQASVGQWPEMIKPKPLSAFFLPPHKVKEMAVPNVSYNHILVEPDEQADSWYDVTIIESKARRRESAQVRVTPSTELTSGTYLSSFRLKITPSDEEPVYLTIPVKIVRY
jgi:hypothetical protein